MGAISVRIFAVGFRLSLATLDFGGEPMHDYKKYLGLHIAGLGIAIGAIGLAIFLKTKKEEHEHGCCH